MDNIIEFSSSFLGHQGSSFCWICQKGNALGALFCQHCGTIQPVHAVDHFVRLGVERRIDIDQEALTKQYNSLMKALSPDRFSLRGMGEKKHAEEHRVAIEEAYQTLKDPLRRSRYWLTLHEQESEETQSTNPLVAELRRELDGAAYAAQCDRVAQKAGQALEQGVVGLMQALRGRNWQLANAMLMEVDGLEAILNDVRTCRAKLPDPQGDNDGSRSWPRGSGA